MAEAVQIRNRLPLAGRGHYDMSWLLRGARIFFALLMLLSLVFPTMLQLLKMVFLAGTTIMLLLAPELSRSRPSPRQRLLDGLAVLYALVGLAWSLGGQMAGNPGAVSMLSVHAAYPLLAALLWRVTRPGDLINLSRILVIGVILVLLTQALFVASFFGLDGARFSSWFVSSLDESVAVVDAGEGYLLFTLPSITSLLFMAPWLFVYVLLGKHRRWGAAILLLCVVGALIFSGRRASLLALLVGLIVAVVASSSGALGRGKLTSIAARLCFLGLILGAILALGIASDVVSADVLTDRLSSIFEFQNNESNIERRLQFKALMDGFEAHPLFGNGLGAAATYTRSVEQPWAYELSYVALLFQFGMIGFMLYLAGTAFLLWSFARLSLRSTLSQQERLYAVCYLAGLLSFLVANATNPYLAKFDYMWTLFAPLGLLYQHAGRASLQHRKTA